MIQQSKGRGPRAIIGVFSWQSKIMHNLVEGRYGSSLGRTLCFLQPLLEQRKMHTTIIMTIRYCKWSVLMRRMGGVNNASSILSAGPTVWPNVISLLHKQLAAAHWNTRASALVFARARVSCGAYPATARSAWDRSCKITNINKFSLHTYRTTMLFQVRTIDNQQIWVKTYIMFLAKWSHMRSIYIHLFILSYHKDDRSTLCTIPLDISNYSRTSLSGVPSRMILEKDSWTCNYQT